MKKRMILLFTVILTAGSIVSACGSQAQSDTAAESTTQEAAATEDAAEETGDEEYEFGKLDIQALGDGVCGAPAYIAYEKGFFAEEGLDVTLVSGTFETNKAGLSSGNYTVANGDFQFFPSVNEGLDIKVIGGLHQGCIKIVVPPGSDIKTAADLAGKNIGVDEVGGTPMAVTSVLLANNDIDPTTGVTWLAYPLDQLTAAVDKGEIDAFAAWDPYGTFAEQEGYTVLSDLSTDPLFADKFCCFLYASGKEIEENPERVAAIWRAYEKAIDWIGENPAEAAQIEIDQGYVASEDVDLITELLESYNFSTEHDTAKEDVEYFTEELKKTGYLPDSIDTKEFTDNLYYDVNS
ncbi:MAG: ABC transporter substrate-binding protein [Lachnospiraceae bacterium]